MSAGKRPTRFLPTLTEIVLPTSQVIHQSDDGPDALVERITLQVVASLQLQLGDTIAKLIQEHVVSLESQIQSEIESAIRVSLKQALSQEEGTFL